MCTPRFPPTGALRSGNISPCRAARSDRIHRAGVHLENRILRGWTPPGVASGQTSNHLKWSDLDLFFARPPRGGPEKFLFLYLNHMNRTEPISVTVVRTGRARSPIHFGRRVRSWLRMNAGGAPNTCKSNGTHLRVEASGERLSNTWRTCPLPRDSRPKGRVIPDTPGRRMAPRLKPRREGMAPRPIR